MFGNFIEWSEVKSAKLYNLCMNVAEKELKQKVNTVLTLSAWHQA